MLSDESEFCLAHLHAICASMISGTRGPRFLSCIWRGIAMAGNNSRKTTKSSPALQSMPPSQLAQVVAPDLCSILD